MNLPEELKVRYAYRSLRGKPRPVKKPPDLGTQLEDLMVYALGCARWEEFHQPAIEMAARLGR